MTEFFFPCPIHHFQFSLVVLRSLTMRTRFLLVSNFTRHGVRPVRLTDARQSMSGVGQNFLMRFEQSRPAHKHILHALNGRRCETSEAHRGSRLEGRPCSSSLANVKEQLLGVRRSYIRTPGTSFCPSNF